MWVLDGGKLENVSSFLRGHKRQIVVWDSPWDDLRTPFHNHRPMAAKHSKNGGIHSICVPWVWWHVTKQQVEANVIFVELGASLCPHLYSQEALGSSFSSPCSTSLLPMPSASWDQRCRLKGAISTWQSFPGYSECPKKQGKICAASTALCSCQEFPKFSIMFIILTFVIFWDILTRGLPLVKSAHSISEQDHQLHKIMRIPKEVNCQPSCYPHMSITILTSESVHTSLVMWDIYYELSLDLFWKIHGGIDSGSEKWQWQRFLCCISLPQQT